MPQKKHKDNKISKDRHKERKESQRPRVSAEVWEQITYLKKLWNLDSANAVLKQGLSSFPTGEKRRQINKVIEKDDDTNSETSSEESIDQDEINLLKDLIIRRIQFEGNISEEKLPLVIALGELRHNINTIPSNQITEDKLNSIISNTKFTNNFKKIKTIASR